MSPRTLTLIGAIALTLLAVGCSNSHKVFDPTSSDEAQVALTQTISEDNIASKLSTPTVERFGFKATLHRTELEGGCWYLETAKGERFEPRFQKEPEVKYDRMELNVYGYADNRTPTYCMIGSIFNVEKYQVLSKESAKTPENAISIKTAKPQEPAQQNTPPTPIITVIGRIHWPAKEGSCVYLETGDDLNFELRFNYAIYPPINPDVKVKIIGRIMPKETSQCVGGPVFLVYSLQSVVEEDNLAKPIKNQPRHDVATPKQAAEPAQLSDPQPIVDHPDVGFLRLQGSFYYTKEGCAFIVTKDRGQVALAFDNQVSPYFPAGALVEVGGHFSLLTVSPCGLGNLFNAQYITRLDNNDRVKAEETLGMPN